MEDSNVNIFKCSTTRPKGDIRRPQPNILEGRNSACNRCVMLPNQGFNINSWQLAELVKRYKLNTLVIMMYPNVERCALYIKSGNDRNIREVAPGSCHLQILLEYIYQQKLPPYLLKDLSQNGNSLFYSGCIIAELWDVGDKYGTLGFATYVLLRPSLESILEDVSMYCEQLQISEKYHDLVESILTRITYPVLHLSPCAQLNDCDDPELASYCSASNNCSNTLLRKCSNVSRLKHQSKSNSVCKFEDKAVKRRKLLLPETKTVNCLRPPQKNCFNSKIKNGFVLPFHGIVKNPSLKNGIIKNCTKPEVTINITSCKPIVVEEYFLWNDCNDLKEVEDKRVKKTEGGECRVKQLDGEEKPLKRPAVEETRTKKAEGEKRLTKLLILWNPVSCKYFGELYLRSTYSDHGTIASLFPFQSQTDYLQYIQQFTTIYAKNNGTVVRLQHHEVNRISQVSSHENNEMEVDD